MKVVEKAAAKVNLGLDTPFRHPDGQPEWDMVMTSIDLADYVEVRVTGSRHISVSSDSGFLPNDQRNLAFQAASLLQHTYQIKAGANIKIKKNIPVAAGLGGGSSDAAAVLRALNRLWKIDLPMSQLAKLGLKVDSDVPYCVFGKTAHVTGLGEQIRVLDPALKPVWIVLAKPNVSVSTPSILRQINYDSLAHPNISGVLTAIDQGDHDLLLANMGNALEPISAKRYPEIKRIKERMKGYGAKTAIMSGTGPTVFTVFNKESRAQRVFNSIRGFCPEAYLVRSL
ncbi:4-(cytidine 5'-diphospho)-2-C-methyl-D-erythritol kinase [Secundilactobacillus folii]|uniref:4-diphosphocytidyl-2-C-methyl-D-erythritol kinase n=1 Tax=Secundilactobacillus folii TaxID=2678357 RepID=A0A7X3C2K3_9LACO|nr:4-(cytidine 5'-diphospho)-2-C-methyl-D-erythritol kinase [Secundilactobacillus folii]MTV82965.1 4-(cytidine 5'-diphospho)-2-C-methyl-D-erythritol kinase [Secundilactobacillus folii]